MEFRDHRPYVPGDDPRKLDWRAVARHDRLVLRRTETEESLEVVFILDGSGGMAYGQDASNKLNVARALVASMGWIGSRQGDRVALARGGAGTVDASLMQRARGREQLTRLVDGLASMTAAGTCPWLDLLDAVAPRLRRHSLVVLVSDLLDPGAGTEDPAATETAIWRGLSQVRARGHDVLAIQVMHRDELEFPWTDRRSTEFVDLREVHPAVEGPASALRGEYLRRLDAHLTAVETACEREGIALERVVTDRPLTESLSRVLGRLSGAPVSREARP
jgi:uncharacterized protein (DUF58 family)